MKQITMDYETYKEELEREWRRGRMDEEDSKGLEKALKAFGLWNAAQDLWSRK